MVDYYRGSRVAGYVFWQYYEPTVFDAYPVFEFTSSSLGAISTVCTARADVTTESISRIGIDVEAFQNG